MMLYKTKQYLTISFFIERNYANGHMIQIVPIGTIIENKPESPGSYRGLTANGFPIIFNKSDVENIPDLFEKLNPKEGTADEDQYELKML